MQQDLHTEQELLLKLAGGDRKAIDYIYKRHYKYISNWIVKNGGDEHDVEDICQESLIVLYEKSKSEEFRLTCRVSTYLFAIAKNLWYKKTQQNATIITEEDQDSLTGNYQDDIKAQHEREVHYEQLDAAIVQLGEPCSSLIKAFYYGNKSMQNIAADFGYTNADNAKTQKYKCLARLKKIFYGMQVK